MHEDATDYYVHESALVDDGALIGSGCKIWHYSHVMSEAVLGENVILGQNVFVAKGSSLGNNVKVQNNVSVYAGVVIEDDVFCGPSMVFTNVINPRSFIERKSEFKTTLVKQGASIGANATIVCGCTLGRYCLVGAGTVVTKDVPDYGLVVGNPAKLIGHICRCGETLRGTLPDDSAASSATGNNVIVCDACGNRYQKETAGLAPLNS